MPLGAPGVVITTRAPAAEAAGEEVTSGGLAVAGTRDPGSVLTGQTAEKELGEGGGQGAGAPELGDSGRARSWQRRGANGLARSPGGRSPRAAGLGCESGRTEG